MTTSPAALITQTYCDTHNTVLKFLQKCSDDQLRWQLPSGSLPLAWHGWHLARWADHLQAAVPGMSPQLSNRLSPGVQLWRAEGFAEKWGWNAAQLGFDETGMEMPDEVALNLAFPPKMELLDYIGRAFEGANRVIGSITDDEFQQDEQPQSLTEGIYSGGTVGEAVMSHMTHANRHLGMMEALLGLQGTRGSAGR